MAGRTTFTPSEADYVSALALHYRHQVRGRRFRWRMAIVIAVSVLMITVIALIVDGDPWLAAATAGGGVLGGMGALLAVLAINRLLLPRLARRLFRQQKSLHRAHEILWNEAGTQWRTEGGDFRHPWADYHCWIDGADTILLMLNDQLFHFLPVRAFDADQLADLRSTVIASEVPPS